MILFIKFEFGSHLKLYLLYQKPTTSRSIRQHSSESFYDKTKEKRGAAPEYLQSTLMTNPGCGVKQH